MQFNKYQQITIDCDFSNEHRWVQTEKSLDGRLKRDSYQQ